MIFKKNKIDRSELDRIKLDFLPIADSVVHTARSCGVALLAYRDPSLSVLESKSNPLDALDNLRQYASVLGGMVASGESPLDSQKFLWRMLKVLELTPQDDIFDKIESDDVVEIYSEDNVQIFRNFNFFKYSSFTVEEVTFVNWTQASKRNLGTTLSYLKFGVRVKTGLFRETENVTFIRPHLMKETLGEKRIFEVAPRYISPLRSQGKVVGGITVSKCRFPDSLPTK